MKVPITTHSSPSLAHDASAEGPPPVVVPPGQESKRPIQRNGTSQGWRLHKQFTATKNAHLGPGPSLEGNARDKRTRKNWSFAIENNRTDLMSDILLRGDGREPRPTPHQMTDIILGADQPNGVLKNPSGELRRALELSIDFPELHRPLKHFLPRGSKKGTGVRLNCKIAFNNNSEEMIQCRHLALCWIKQIMARGKPDYGILGDHDNIARSVPWEIDGEYVTLRANVRTVHMVANQAWGAFVVQQFTEMQQGDIPASRCMLVESGIHAMALQLQIKLVPDSTTGQSKYVFVEKFYDPNKTGNHRLATSDSMDRMGTHSLEGMHWCGEDYNYNFGANGQLGSETVSMVFVLPDGYLGAPTPLTAPERAARRPATMPGHTDASVLHHLIAHGFTGADIPGLLAEKIAQNPGMEAELLAAENSEQTPGLFKALQDGHAETVEMFTNLVMASATLTLDQKAALLAAKRTDKTPGLHIASQEGHGHAAQILTGAVLASPLELEQKVELLTAKDIDETPGLFIASQEGHAHVLQILTGAVFALPLDPWQTIDLLAAKDADGTPALFIASQGGHAHAVQILIGAVLASALEPEQKIDLLAAKDSDGNPGLCVALLQGHVGAVRAWAGAILASKLEPEQKVRLLAAENADRTPGIYRALNQGHDAAASAWRDAIQTSDLTADQKEALLPPI